MSIELNFRYIEDIVTKVQKLKNGFMMNPFEERMFSFEFVTMEDKQKVLDMSYFLMASNIFVIRPWHLFVEVEIEEMKIIPIWVIIKRLPMEL